MKKALSFILAFCLLVSTCLIPVSAAQINDGVTIEPNDDIDTFAEQLVQGLNAGRNLDLSVGAIKELYDFAGNIYYAIEFSPTGYCIVHGESRSVVELGTSAISPYFGYDKGLFYGGPTYYYVIGDDSLEHTILEESLQEEDLVNAIPACNDLHDALCSEDSRTDAAEIAAVVNSTQTLMENGDFIEDLTSDEQIGYVSIDDGVCGFIAAGIFLLFLDQKNENVINNFAFLNGEQAFRGPSFTEKLVFEYGTGSSSSGSGALASSSIQDVLEQYLADVSCAIPFSLTLNTLSYSSVLNHLKYGKSPVICFGAFYHPYDNVQAISHAVTAYGWTSDDRLVVHFGWANATESRTYNKIELRVQLAGESLMADRKDLQSSDIVFSDIASTSWAYPGAAYCARYQIIDYQVPSSNTFGISENMTRAMFINGLYHLLGEKRFQDLRDDDNDGDKKEYIDVAAICDEAFSDVNSSTKYLEALGWAYHEEYILGDASNGVPTGTLRPTDYITREEACAILKRVFGEDGENLVMNVDYSKELDDFVDSADIAGWARADVLWAYRRGLFKGNTHNQFLPKANIRKVEAAAVFERVPGATSNR